jgi:hypothetical protein
MLASEKVLTRKRYSGITASGGQSFSFTMPPTDQAHPLYAARVWQMGKSVVFPLYKAVLDAIGAKAGDLVLVRVHPPYVTFRIAQPDKAVPASSFTSRELPPKSPRDLKRQLEEQS